MGALDGKGALVTGGSRGIGRAIVKRLAADGAAVVFSYLQNETAAADVVREVAGNGGRAVAVRADQAAWTTCGGWRGRRTSTWTGSTSWSSTRPAARWCRSTR